MNFEDWLKTKGYMDGYSTDYQDAYDEGFDEGVLHQKDKLDELQNKVIDQQNAFDKLYNSYEATMDELVSYRSRFGNRI